MWSYQPEGIGYSLQYSWASFVAQSVKNLPAMYSINPGDLGLIPGLGRSPGKGHGNPLQYSCLGESPWTEEPGRPQSLRLLPMRLPRLGHEQVTKHSMHQPEHWPAGGTAAPSGMETVGTLEKFCLLFSGVFLHSLQLTQHVCLWHECSWTLVALSVLKVSKSHQLISPIKATPQLL